MKNLSIEGPSIHPTASVNNATFGSFTEISEGARILNVDMGDYSYTDRFADIANATIGKFANIASFARIGPTDHPMHLASQHHMLYRSNDYWPEEERWEEFFEHRQSRKINIGHDIWIGTQAIIKPEVTIGHGAIIAMGSIVTKDVAPYMIIAGIPAKPIRERFTKPIAERLMALEWWDWSHQLLQQ